MFSSYRITSEYRPFPVPAGMVANARLVCVIRRRDGDQVAVLGYVQGWLRLARDVVGAEKPSNVALPEKGSRTRHGTISRSVLTELQDCTAHGVLCASWLRLFSSRRPIKCI